MNKLSSVNFLRVTEVFSKNTLISLARYLLFVLAYCLIPISNAQAAALDANKSFNPATVYPSEISTVVIELQNSSVFPGTGASFTDVLPDNVFVAATPNATTTCGGTVTHSNGATSGQLTLSGGIIPAGDGTNPGKCRVTIDTTTPSKGTYINTIAAGDVTATVNSAPESNGQASTATLTALINPFTIEITSDKDSTPNSPTSRIYLHGHETGVMTLKLVNPNPVPLTDVVMDWDFSDQYVGSWIHLIDGTGGGDCGGTLTITDAVAGDALYRPEVDADYAGGTIPANGSCTITVQMQTRAYSDLSAAERYASFTIAPNTFTTTEGATNANASKTSQTNWGLSIEKRFDGETLRQVHAVSGTSTSVLSLAYENHEADTVALDVTDIMPTSPGQMTVVSIDSNTCGGTVTTNGGTEINIAGGSIAGSPGSYTAGKCELRATVSVLEDGTYTNDIPAGTTGGHVINSASATLIKTSGAVTITKAKQNPANNTGDENVYTYTIANLSDPTVGIDVSNLRLRDNFDVISNTGYNYGKLLTISQANVMSSTCAGTVFNAAPGDEFFDVSGVSVPKGSSCQIKVQVSVKANDEDYTYGAFENIAVKTNAADATEEGVVYDVGANTDQLFGAEVLLQQSIFNSFSLNMAFIPDTVNVDGVSRLRYEIRSSTTTNPAIDNLFLRNTLPAGLTIATSPNFSSTCGGSLNSVPGSDYIEFSGGYMTGNVLTAPINLLTYSSSRTCWVELDVRAPLTSGAYTSIIPTDPKLTPLADLEVTGRKIGEIAPYSQFYRSYSDSATLNVLPVEIGVNKTFLTPVIGGGEASRVRITIANNTTGAPSLTGVSLTDLFSGSDMALYSNVDGTFTDTSGSSSNKCRNATITGNPGDQSITLSDAVIDTGGICQFEFNITADVGGNHINNIAIGDVKSDQGITNNIAVSATLTVDRELNIAKGFNPSNVGPGETTTLSVEVVNSNQAPVNYTGSAVSLIDEMPAGISIQSIVSNSCGGTATIGSQNGNDTIQLSGGSFPAETTCRINALVSAATPGSYTNTISAASLMTNEGATNPNAVSATLSVNVPPRIVKSFYPSTIGPGMNSRITFTVFNDAALAISGLNFSDTLINMNLTSPTLVGGTCQSVDYTATAGGNTFEVTGGVVPANGSCTITTQITSSTVGVHDNVTSGVDSDQTGLGLPSNVAKLTVQELPVLAKSFTPAIIQAGTVSTLTFTLTNPNDAEVRMESWYYAFQDFFPTGMTVAATPNVTMNCRLGELKNLTYDGVVTAGDVGVTFDFGFVPANGSCTASVDVTVDNAGSYVNTTTAAKTEYLGYTPAATATLLATTGAPPDFDYGDAPTAGTAPAGNGSNNYGEPRHQIVAGLYLGAGLPDADASYQSSATADGDDADGTDDDDGVSSFPSLLASDSSYSIPAANISATGTGTLHAWIDLNGNGSFESSEYTSTTLSAGVLAGPLTWAGLPGVVEGDSFIRLRLTTDTTVNALAPASAAIDGEVEDHPLTIQPPPTDYSDGPTSGVAYGDAKHIIVTGIQLGATIDDDTTIVGGIASANADGDDTTGINDNDGVTIPELIQGLHAVIDVEINQAAANDGHLQGWIDWNGNGVFETSEQVATDMQFATGTTGTIRVVVNVPLAASTASQTIARFRWSTTNGLNSTAPASDGEVEDYLVDITAKSPDVVARPASCGAYNHAGWLTAGGPNINTGVVFGSGDPDSDPYVYAGLSRDADGRVVTYYGDLDHQDTGSLPGPARFELNQDSPTLPGPYISEYHHSVYRLDGAPGSTTTVKFLSNGGADNIYAWIENTAGDVLAKPAEFIYGTFNEVPLTFTFPTDGVVYLYGSLFDPSSSYGGTKVEDYACPDYGDAPTSGIAPDGTSTNNYGDAGHVPVAGVRLGAIDPDSDNASPASPAADGDDLDGVDDEDAFTRLPPMWSDQPLYRLQVPCAPQGAKVAGWIDHNLNGQFDAGERNSNAPANCNAQGRAILDWTGLSGLTVGSTFARLRIASAEADLAMPTGVATDGEVEDYPLIIQNPGVKPGQCEGVMSWLNVGGQSADPVTPWNVSWPERGVNAEIRFSTTMTGTNQKWFAPIPGDTFTDASFISQYGSSGYRFNLNHPNDLSGTGSTITNIIFDKPLPGPVWLVIKDIDANSESITLSGSNLGTFSAPSLWETRDPISGNTPSIFASWDNVTQQLTSMSSGPTNDQEAYVWNITGLQTVTAEYKTFAGSANIGFVTCLSGDYGDAPDTYGTTKAAGGAEHRVANDLYLGGARPDMESDGIPSTAADGDDSNAGGDDEDGVVMPLPTLTPLDNSYRITVNATNGTANPGRLIAWIDFDRNGTFEPEEAAARVVPAGTTAGSFVVAWANVPTDIQAGTTYLRLRFTTDAMNAGDPKGKKNDGEVEDYVLTIGDAGATVTGRVYIDANSSAAEDLGEAGIGGTVIVLFESATGTCRSTRTNANGDYSFFDLADGTYEVFQAHGETTPTPQNCVAAPTINPPGYQSTTPDALMFAVTGADVSDKNFGEVAGTNSTTSGNTGAGLRFEPDHQSEILPGNVVFYAHTFSSDADGAVRFAITGSNNTTLGWTHLIYRDSNCNGELDGTEANTPVEGINFGISAGSQLCIIDKVYAPSNVAAQDSYTVETIATFSYAGGAALPSTELKVTDITTASQTTQAATQATPSVGQSLLKLRKTVENLTQATAETETLNQAAPGDVLKYRIYYRNAGTGPITDLKVNDTVPPFTGFVLNSEACDVTPAGMTCVPTRNLEALDWEFTGPLVGGTKGHVSYEVAVDN